MICEACGTTASTVRVGGHTACEYCGAVVSGGPSVRSLNFQRRGVNPERVSRGVAEAIAENSATSGLCPEEKSCLARAAQASVSATFAKGRAPSAAARVLAERVVGAVLAAPRAVPPLKAAEDIVASVDRRAVGRSSEAAALLKKAREVHGACVPTEETTEGAWCLAAVAAVTVGHPGPVDEDALQERAMDAAVRCDLPLKGVCGPAIAEVWRYGMS